RLERELRAAAVARRGGARQTRAALQDAGRSLAPVRKSARAVRLHVGALGQETYFHGRGNRPVARMGSRFEPRLEPARLPGPSRTAGADARFESHLSRRARA